MVVKGRRILAQGVGSTQYSIASASGTSAGIYNSGGTKVRELWAGQQKAAGTYPVYWDGLLDDGTTAPADTYTAKVLSSNVTAAWDGAIVGNTGNPVTGASKLRAFEATKGVTFVGDKAFWAIGYEEGWPSNFITSVANPENGKLWFDRLKETNCTSEFVVTDGTTIYYGGYDPISPNSRVDDTDSDPDFHKYKTLVFGFNNSDNSRKAFSSGVPVKMMWGSTYNNAIAYNAEVATGSSVINGTNTYQYAFNSKITGMAVQQTNPFLFVCRGGLNQLKVVNKTTGALVQTLSITGAAVVSVDASDNIWLAHGTTVEKYTVNNSTGAITTTGVTITGITAGGIDVSPDGTTVAICDMDNQVLKGFNTTTGALSWTLGTTGGYFSDATVTNSKFFWKDANGVKSAYVKYLSDGSFYLGDGYNERALVFNSSRTFVKVISWKIANYFLWADKVNPSRVYNDFLEYSIDYTKTLAANNGSWVLAKNWGANFDLSQYDSEGIRNLITLSNGRTYATLRLKIAIGSNVYKLIELVQGGTIRDTGLYLTQYQKIQDDGSLINSNDIFNPANTTYSVTRKALTGFDGSNNPVWSGTATTIVNAVPVNPFASDYQLLGSELIAFNRSASAIYDNTDYHLGAVNNGGTSWIFKTARGTSRNYTGPFPSDGAFDNGNGVNVGLNGAGGFMSLAATYIMWSYHGEFWKGSQTNKFNMVDANTGLFVKQFGSLSLDHFANEEAASEGGDGNILSGSYVENNGIGYVYTNGESNGIHRWQVSGLSTIQIQTVTPTIGTETLTGTDLLSGITTAISTLPNNFNGWSRTPTSDVSDGTGVISTTIGKKSYDTFKQVDLSMYYSRSSGSNSIKRDLGTNNIYSWSVKGTVSFEANSFTEAHLRGGSYIQVKDGADKAIAQFDFRQTALNGEAIIFNNQTVFSTDTDTTINISALKYYEKPFEIINNNGTFTINWAGITLSTTTLQDVTANKNNPKYFEWYCFTNNPADDKSRLLTIHSLRFYNS